MTRITEADHLALKRQADIADLWAMEFYMVKQYQNEADLIINGDPRSIEEFRRHVELMDAKKELVRGTVDTADERQWLADIDQLDSQFDALFFEQVVPAQQAGDQELLVTLDGQSDQLVEQMEEATNKMIASYQSEVVEAQAAAEAASRQATWLMAIGFVVSAGVGLVFGLFLSRSISNPVQAVTYAAARLAEGDVAQNVTVVSGDEIGEMTDAFRQMIAYQQAMANAADRLAQGDLTVDVAPQSDKDVLGNAFAQMIASLRDLIRQVTDNADNVSVASEQLTAAAEQSGQATGQVAATVQQVAQGTSQQTDSVTRRWARSSR